MDSMDEFNKSWKECQAEYYQPKEQREPRSERLEVRLTQSELRRWKEQADKYQLSVSDWLRKRVNREL